MKTTFPILTVEYYTLINEIASESRLFPVGKINSDREVTDVGVTGSTPSGM